MKYYLFDKKDSEKRHYTIGQWIVAVIILAILAGLVIISIATWIKWAMSVWGL